MSKSIRITKKQWAKYIDILRKLQDRAADEMAAFAELPQVKALTGWEYSQTLVSMAEQLNARNGDALRTIALMAIAIANRTTLDKLTDTQKNIVAHFKNPAMPSVAVTADAAIKIASARPDFGSTDTFLEMIGFDQADIRRIRSQEQRVRGQRVLDEIEQL